ncbi:RDD family protein [Arthrobacter sp. UYCo732]|uniref:RDD family protein n=1 Tax=Arthrobacter sp. UYCo732 TaxID=3156336 RepID=UPI0033941F4F
MTTSAGTTDMRLTTLKNGMVVMKAKDRHIFAAWLLDWSLILVLSLGTYIALLKGDPLTALLAAAAVWPAGAFVYGLACCYRRSIGQAAAGTRTVRLDNGQVPGFWRSGYMMVLRLVLLPFAFSGLVIVALGSTAPTMEGPRDRHLSIDVRATAGPSSQVRRA